MKCNNQNKLNIPSRIDWKIPVVTNIPSALNDCRKASTCTYNVLGRSTILDCLPWLICTALICTIWENSPKQLVTGQYHEAWLTLRLWILLLHYWLTLVWITLKIQKRFDVVLELQCKSPETTFTLKFLLPFCVLKGKSSSPTLLRRKIIKQYTAIQNIKIVEALPRLFVNNHYIGISDLQ